MLDELAKRKCVLKIFIYSHIQKILCKHLFCSRTIKAYKMSLQYNIGEGGDNGDDVCHKEERLSQV